ncbi:MAG: hypothetical protein P8046_15000 [Anaerolineales bacterium]
MAKSLVVSFEVDGFEDPFWFTVTVDGFEDPILSLKQMGVCETRLSARVKIKGFENQPLRVQIEP